MTAARWELAQAWDEGYRQALLDEDLDLDPKPNPYRIPPVQEDQCNS